MVPDLQTDFIFTAIANEMGLLGAAGIILVYLLFVWRGFRIAVYAPDGFSKLLAAGLATAFALQTFIIIGGVTRLIPLTGITLPFVSYGGSSITANLMLVALLLMVSQPHQRHARRHRARAPAAGGEGVGAVNKAMSRSSSSASCSSSRSSSTSRGSWRCAPSGSRTGPENKRSIAKEMKIKRGDILGYDGSVIAGTERRSGYYYRDYPNGTLAPQLVGYDSRALRAQRHRGAAQRRAHRPVHRPRRAELGGQAARAPAQGRQRQAHPRAGGAEGRRSSSCRARRARSSCSTPRPARSSPRPRRRPTTRPTSRTSWATLSKDTSRAAAQPADPGPLRAGLGLQGRHRLRRARHRQGHARHASSSTPAPTSCSAARSPTTAARSSAPTTSPTALTLLHQHDLRQGRATCWGASGSSPALQRFGFYQTPPLPLPAGEVVASGRYGKKGLLSPDAFMDPLDVAWAACGQERLLATPLQMALVAGGVANGGRVMKPYYVQEIVTPDGAGGAEGAAGAVAGGDEAADGDASSTR